MEKLQKYSLVSKYFFISLMLIFLMASCNKKSYISEIPNTVKPDDYDSGDTEGSDFVDDSDGTNESSVVDDYSIYIKEKWSKYFRVLPKDINVSFYGIIDKYLEKPYGEGLFSSKGLSMDRFANILYKETYGIDLERLPIEIYKSENIEKFSGRNFLEEGDIVFLSFRDYPPIEGIAIYLKKDMVIATNPEGELNIWDFSEDYFQKYFYAGGRIIIDK